MFAIIAFICGVIAAVLKLVNNAHANQVIWLLIAGLISASVELVWAWHRGGYYRHPPA